MQLQSYGLFYSNKSGHQIVQLFAYSSHGAPGIQIIGLGKYACYFREKLTFISKSQALRLPLKRFVLCVEDELDFKNLTLSDIRWLEFPLLIVLWRLFNAHSLYSLSDCLTCGKVSAANEVFQPILEKGHLKNLCLELGRNLKYIGIDASELGQEFISAQAILSHLPKLQFRQV